MSYALTLNHRAVLLRRQLFATVFGATLLGLYMPTLWIEDASAPSPSLVPLFAALLMLLQWWRLEQSPADGLDFKVAAFYAIALCVPSQQLAWALLFLGAAYLWTRQQRTDGVQKRRTLAVLAMSATVVPLTTYSLKLFAAPVLSMDAYVTAALLHAFTGTGSHIGNIVIGPGEHRLLILRGCSSIHNLGSAWLVWLAISTFVNIRAGAYVIAMLLVLGAAIVGLNVLRLYTMALDMHWHSWWHSTSGQWVYQIGSATVLLVVIAMAMRHGRAA